MEGITRLLPINKKRAPIMRSTTTTRLLWRGSLIVLPLLLILGIAANLFHHSAHASAATSPYSQPTWWGKYQRLLQTTPASASHTGPLSVGANVDVSNEDTPQSEISITIDPNKPKMLVGGSNESVRRPMRGYFSSDGGK